MTSQYILQIEKVRMSEKAKVCELCEEQPAVVLCAECCKCYCDECSKYAHGKALKKDHKAEVIPKGVRVDAMCPLHKNSALSLLCVDDTELCCAMCDRDKFHKDHKVVKVSEVAEDNEVFSAAKVRESSVMCPLSSTAGRSSYSLHLLTYHSTSVLESEHDCAVHGLVGQTIK